MQAGIARHPAKREGRFFACQRASGSWYAGLSAALDQGVDGETHLSHRQANTPRVQAVKPYHTIPIPNPLFVFKLDCDSLAPAHIAAIQLEAKCDRQTSKRSLLNGL